MFRGHSVALACLALGLWPSAALANRARPSTLVETRVGTDEGSPDFGTGGGAGATFPGAVAPFGMLQVSPDTNPSLRNPSGGYTYSDHQIKGFGLTHLSGAGCAALQDVPILPTTHAVDASPSTAGSYDIDPRYLASFTHDGEVATPGDYRVHLDPGTPRPLDVEATAGARAGALRMTFPAGSPGSVLVNPGGSAMGDFAADVHVDAARREITGSVTSGMFCSAPDRYRVFFAIRFDQPFAASGTWTKQTLVPSGTDASDTSSSQQVGVITLQYKRVAGLPDQLPGNPSTGAQAGGYATFAARDVTARVAISSVSVSGAQKNLDADASAPFDTMRTRAVHAWDKELGKVRIGGGTSTQQRLFYTSLYHALTHPSLFSDADGRYRGMDDRIHTAAAGHDFYANLSGWDTYRAQLPLMAMLDPHRASDLASSLVDDYRASGHLPKWSLREGQTNVMVGDPSDLLLAGAYAYGARDFDLRTALAAAVTGATDVAGSTRTSSNGSYVQRAGLADYLKHGYVGYEQNTSTIGQTQVPLLTWGTASTTLEYATADFGIARLARAVGDAATCTTFAQRSGNWRNVFDPAVSSMRARLASTGGVVEHGDASDDGFVEGSAAQYTWAVPQDVAGLVTALGGPAKARAKLGGFFAELNGGVASTHAFLGNEPTLHTPYLYDWLGAPAAGAGIVRRAMLGLYKLTPGGFPGNDDLGAMSSWWVFNALGFYPAVPGAGVLALGSPLFPHAQVQLAGGTLRIDAPRAAAHRPYVRAATFRGHPLTRTWLSWPSIAHGGRLQFTLSSSAKQTWGAGAGAAPPSFGGDAACTAGP